MGKLKNMNPDDMRRELIELREQVRVCCNLLNECVIALPGPSPTVEHKELPYWIRRLKNELETVKKRCHNCECSGAVVMAEGSAEWEERAKNAERDLKKLKEVAGCADIALKSIHSLCHKEIIELKKGVTGLQEEKRMIHYARQQIKEVLGPTVPAAVIPGEAYREGDMVWICPRCGYFEGWATDLHEKIKCEGCGEDYVVKYHVTRQQ